MLALTAAPGRPANLDLREVDEPVQRDNEVLVRVRAISLNRGETRRLADMQDGERVGWDLAGIVERTAEDGTGPPVGSRVVGFLRTNAWAELAAVPTNWLAVLRDDVTFEQAATLPVAGLTALRALDIIGPVIARRVLVTGASGGVGRFAVQLAKLAGAHVTGVSASAERAQGLRELGADDIIHELRPDGDEFDGIVEGVGGASLGAAIQRVAAQGTIVSFASSDPAPVRTPRGRSSRVRRARSSSASSSSPRSCTAAVAGTISNASCSSSGRGGSTPRSTRCCPGQKPRGVPSCCSTARSRASSC